MHDLFLDLHDCRVCQQFWEGDVEGADEKLVAVMREHCRLAHPSVREVHTCRCPGCPDCDNGTDGRCKRVEPTRVCIACWKHMPTLVQKT
jgi:hypothetical protein